MTSPTGTRASAYVEVNECRVFATRLGSAWWATFQLATPQDRFDHVAVSIGGNLVRVACDSRADAAWLAGHMVEAGIPKTAVKVGVHRG